MSSVGRTEREERNICAVCFNYHNRDAQKPSIKFYNTLHHRQRTMLKSQFFLNYMPEVSPADILLTPQNIENTPKCRRLTMQGTEAVNTERWKQPSPTEILFTPCAAAHNRHLQQNIIKNMHGEETLTPQLWPRLNSLSLYYYHPTSLT